MAPQQEDIAPDHEEVRGDDDIIEQLWTILNMLVILIQNATHRHYII